MWMALTGTGEQGCVVEGCLGLRLYVVRVQGVGCGVGAAGGRQGF